MLEVFLIDLTPPEFHIRDLEVTPKVARGISVGLDIDIGPPLAVCQPLFGVILYFIFGMRRKKLQCLRPQGRYRLRRIEQVDGEPVGFVVILHVAEDIVVHVTKEMDFRLDPPVVSDVGQGRMAVEHARVPAAHLVIGNQIAVLNLLLSKHLSRLFEKIVVDPGGDVPVFLWD